MGPRIKVKKRETGESMLTSIGVSVASHGRVRQRSHSRRRDRERSRGVILRTLFVLENSVAAQVETVFGYGHAHDYVMKGMAWALFNQKLLECRWRAVRKCTFGRVERPR